MREITVKIPENKYDAFVAMMKELKIEVPEHGVDDEIEIPEWQKKIVRERMEVYKKNPKQAIDFDTAMNNIEKDL